MLFYNHELALAFILIFLGICSKKCVANIEENKFTFMTTISRNKEPNVYREFTLPSKRIPILACSAVCRNEQRCIGLDICGGRICRLWNVTHYQSIPMNGSNELCKWYTKIALKKNTYFNVTDPMITPYPGTTSTQMGSTISEGNSSISIQEVNISTSWTDEDHSSTDRTPINGTDKTTYAATTPEMTIKETITKHSEPQNTTDEVNVMPYEFSKGDFKDVPYYSETYVWIVIQRRFDGSVDFYRNWTEYEDGFGSPQSEIWLGNRYIHELTTDGYTVLRIELTGCNGEMRHIEYDFSIENETNHYRLHISERNTSGIDSLLRSDLAFFCTYDKDNDNWYSANCADSSQKASGWWHSKTAWCTDGNLNGIYKDQYLNFKQGIHWFEWDKQWTLKKTKMMLRKP